MTYSEPLLCVLLAGLLVSLWQLGRRAPRMLWVSAAAFFLITWPPFDWLVARHLEIWYPLRPFHQPPTGAIVVLSAAVSPAQWERPFELPNDETVARCEYGAWLYHEWKTAPVLVSGGSDGLGQPYAATMKTYLLRAGVPESMIWTEEQSHSTFENALYSARILRRRGVQRIALVVEAQSMLRAEASFRKQGIDVVPAPCTFRDLGPWQVEALPNWRAVRRNEITLHETLGLVWYKLLGRI